MVSGQDKYLNCVAASKCSSCGVAPFSSFHFRMQHSQSMINSLMLNIRSYIKNRNVTNHNISFLVVEIFIHLFDHGKKYSVTN